MIFFVAGVVGGWSLTAVLWAVFPDGWLGYLVPPASVFALGIVVAVAIPRFRAAGVGVAAVPILIELFLYFVMGPGLGP